MDPSSRTGLQLAKYNIETRSGSDSFFLLVEYAFGEAFIFSCISKIKNMIFSGMLWLELWRNFKSHWRYCRYMPDHSKLFATVSKGINIYRLIR